MKLQWRNFIMESRKGATGREKRRLLLNILVRRWM